MKKALKKATGIVMALLMMAQLLPTALAAEDDLELANAMDADVGSITLTSGEVYQPFSSSTYTYDATLGPKEGETSFIVLPTETEFPPTLELFLDGDAAAYDVLTPGIPSRPVQLEPGQVRTVTIRSTPHSAEAGGSIRAYTFTIHRTPTLFSWTAGAVREAQGGTVLPVTLSAPAGTRLETLKFTLYFDPAKLQLCDSTGTMTEAYYSCVAAAEDFYYSSRTRKGYFTAFEKTSGADNTAGSLTMEFGAFSNSINAKNYVVGAEALLTVYFKVVGSALDWDSLSLPERNCISATEQVGAQFRTSKCRDMVEIRGLPAPPAEYHVVLPPKSFTGGSLAIAPEKTTYSDGEALTLTAQPDECYQFDRWEAGPASPELISGGAVLKLHVTADLDLSALAPVFTRTPSPLPDGAGVDRESPYGGEYLLTVNGSSGTQGVQLFRTEEGSTAVQGIDGEGLTRLECRNDWQDGEDGGLESANVTPADRQVGDQAAFLTRNMNGTSAGNNVWVSKTFTLKASSASLNLWFEDGNPMEVTPEQFAELGNSFERTLKLLEEQFGSVYDRNGNGKLDILLYDIQDAFSLGSSNTYYAGLTNGAELYGNIAPRKSVGNNADVLHLDTYPSMGRDFTSPSVDRVLSTMAHETQHLVMYSSVSEQVAQGGVENSQISAMLPPAWINEGLSMAVEHVLFGVRDDRIDTFNTSADIRDGYSLTQWGNQVEDYALSYLFLEYLSAQAEAAGVNNLLQGFYSDYSGDSDGVILSVIQKIPEFAGMNFDEVLSCFYAALMLQQDTGAYGFCGDRDFDRVNPQIYTGNSVSLPAAGAVYTALTAEVALEEGGSITYLGLTPAPITLTATAEPGGKVVWVSPEKNRYGKGDTVTLTAAAEKGYRFIGWSGVDAGPASGDTVTLTLYRAQTVQAHFAILVESLFPGAVTDASGRAATVTVEGGSATLTVEGGSLAELKEHTPITLMAVPEAGKRFAGWRVTTNAGDAEERASVEGGPTLVTANPWQTEALTGRSVTPVFETESDTAGPRLHSMELSAPEGRQLIQAETGYFGFDERATSYRAALLPDETGVALTLRTEDDVTGVAIEGTGTAVLTAQAGAAGGLRWYESGQDVLLTLEKGKTSGSFTVKLANAAGGETVYHLTLERAASSPTAQLTAEGGNAVAAISGAELFQGSIALKIPAGTYDTSGMTPDSNGCYDVTAVLDALNPGLPAELAFARAVVINKDAAPPEEACQILKLTVDNGASGMALKAPFAITLFAGTLAGVSVYEADRDNSISDARFGALYGTTQIGNQVNIQGRLIAFDPKSEVTVQVWTGAEFAIKESEAVAVAASAAGTGRFEAAFSVMAPQDTECQLVFQKKGHVPYTVVLNSGTGMTISEALYLACGDVNEDERIDFEDKFRLTGPGYGSAANPGDPDLRDFNGDGSVDARDLNLLTGRKHYGASKQSQWLDLRGKRGV